MQFVAIDYGGTLWVAVKELGGNLQLFEASLVVCSGAGPWWTLVMEVIDCGAKHIMHHGCCASLNVGLLRKKYKHKPCNRAKP